MFFNDDHRKIATVLVGKRKPNGERVSAPAPMKSEETMTSDGEIDPRHLASEDMMSAMHEKSPQKLMEALANFMDLHQAHRDTLENADSD